MSRPGDPSRDLLFGLLALQNGLIDQEALFAAFAAWTRDRARSLADHLVDARTPGCPSPGRRRGHRRPACPGARRRHREEPHRPGRRTRDSRDPRTHRRPRCRGDPRVRRLDAGLDPRRRDPERTGSYAVGSATSDGQRFRILRPHARGGLGAVFVALDSELDREVALKQILDDRADDPVSRSRFLVEAQITGGLEHPGIVPVYGLGTHGDGRPYYAMRFIRGDSLKEAIDQFHDGARIPGGLRPRLARTSSSASCSADSWTSATPSTTPTRAA